MFQLMSSLLSTVIGFNAHNAAIIQSYKKEEVDFPRYVFNSVIVIFLSVFLFLVFGQMFKTWISGVISFPEDWIFTIVIFATCQVLFQLLLGLFISSQRPVGYGVFQVSQTAFNLGLSLLLVVYFGFGWEGRIFFAGIGLWTFWRCQPLFIVEARKPEVENRCRLH